MSGYTPVFGTVFNGSLCGKWPTTAVWMFFLALADSKGEVDVSHKFIAGMTGIPEVQLREGIAALMAEDPLSRSTAEGGRRLVLLDPANRDWGWRIVNIQKYRDKASDLNQHIDGRHAEKNRRYRERHGLTAGGRPRKSLNGKERPRETAESQDRLTQTHTHTQKNPPYRSPLLTELPEGINREAWGEWIAYRRERRLPLTDRALSLHVKLLLPHPPEVQRAMIEESIQATWAGLFPLKGPAVAEANKAALMAWANAPEPST